jgi:small subunit ribosomal protein S6
MFLFDSARVQEWAAVEAELKRLFERIGATQRVAIKFDERKLSFEINKRKRGLFVLTYFDADTQKIGDLERDARLSEVLLRLLVLKATNITDEKIAELQAKPADQPIAPPPAERRYGDRPRFGGRDGGRDGGRPERRPRRDDGDQGAKPAPEAEKSAAPAGDPASN